MTENMPKSLVPIIGEPFIGHQLRLLRSKGIKRVVLCAGFLGKRIEEFVGDGARFGIGVSYSFDGGTLLGTAGAIRKALPLLDEAFFVLYGDSYLECDYGRVAEAFESSQRRGLMTIYRNAGHFDASNVEVQDGLIVRYDKRNRSSAMQHIDYGLGVFARSVFVNLAPNECHNLPAVYEDLLQTGELASYEVTNRFYEIGSLTGIRDLEERLTEHNPTTSEAVRTE